MDPRDRAVHVKAASLGLSVDAHRPDGGRRRYQFGLPSGERSSVLIGVDDAEVYLEAYESAHAELQPTLAELIAIEQAHGPLVVEPDEHAPKACRYRAHFGDYDEGIKTGTGSTPARAINDLLQYYDVPEEELCAMSQTKSHG